MPRMPVVIRSRHLIVGGIAVVVLALSLALIPPHYHEDSAASASDSDQSCRACQLDDGLSATPPVLPTLLPPNNPIVLRVVLRPSVPHTTVLAQWSDSRAPPHQRDVLA